jgi:DNA repair protein RAD50
MSRIDRLAIMGVRSFDNTHSEVMQFYAPLTLIVGHNGSGKTTIIECLKYATTGELPPNSKGGAFIHDPKLCGEKEVMAQVKLKFTSTTKAQMVVTRSLQLTVKKLTRTQKTLECNLVVQNHGERESLSTRVAELDQMLPQYLGVSKAVLDAVIFCHQDESLWPMSEPASLKKKFDEIFEALRYTKAIENIKQLRKKQNEELGKFKIIEQHSKEDKVKADKAEERSKALADEIEDLREAHQELHKQVEEADRKAKEAWNNVARYTEAVESLKAARRNKEHYEQDLADLRRDLKELPDTDEQLRSQVEQYQERMKLHNKRQEDQTKRYKSMGNDIEQIHAKQSNKRMEAGKLENQKATHEQQIKEREAMIKSSARDHNIRGYETDLDDMEISEFMQRVTKLSSEQNSRVDRLRRDNAAEVQKSQSVLDKLRERRSTLNESKRSHKEQIALNERKVASSNSELGRITMDEAGKAILEANIEDLEDRLRKAKQTASSASFASKIKEANETLQKLEDDSDSLKSEMVQATKQAGDLARLDHLKKESQSRQRSIDTLKETHGPRLQVLLGHSWEPETLDDDFRNVLDNRKRKVADAERQREGVSRELEHVEFKLKSAREDEKRKQKEFDLCAAKIRDKTEGEPVDFPMILQELQDDRDAKKSDVENFKHTKDYFDKCIAQAKAATPACRLCARTFNDEEETRLALIRRLERMTSSREHKQYQDDLAELEISLNTAKEASQSYDSWVRLEKEIPEIKKDIKKLEEERADLVRQVESQDSAVSGLQEAKSDVDALSRPVATILQCVSEQQSFKKQVEELVHKQKDAGGDRTLDEIQEQIEALGIEAKEQRKIINRLQAESERNRDQISSLSLDLGNAKNKLSTAEHELEKRATIISQISDLKESNKQQRETMQSLDNQLQELGPAFEEEETKLQEVRARGDAKEKEFQREANNLTDTVRRLQRIDQEVRSYIDQGGPAKLEKCLRDIEDFDKELTSLKTEQSQIAIEINGIQKEIANQDQHKRVINDNLKYRSRKRELDEAEAEIQRLSDQNAEADQQRYHRDAERYQRDHQQARMQETSKMAAMKVKDDQLQQLLQDWNTDYKDAAHNYRKAHIQVETTRAAVDDLGKYGGALDKAIMRYHSLKMEEINRIVDELWRSTYQGTDVDTIMIRSDNETAKGNRSYNYRVCMVKQDAEMDMRGRCSAGQKVLASIIIRLALAECFGVNCGLIALDEPTTNLDRDNIRSLAESLHAIIKERQKQNNFQLIVITHDEEFLRYMKCADFCDNYWRISRNNKQKSVIERQSIAQVM